MKIQVRNRDVDRLIAIVRVFAPKVADDLDADRTLVELYLASLEEREEYPEFCLRFEDFLIGGIKPGTAVRWFMPPDYELVP